MNELKLCDLSYTKYYGYDEQWTMDLKMEYINPAATKIQRKKKSRVTIRMRPILYLVIFGIQLVYSQ